MDNFQQLKTDYLKSKRLELEQLEAVELPPMESISFNFKMLENPAEKERLTGFVANVKNRKLLNVLYYFSLRDSSKNSEIIERAQSFKDNNEKPLLPKLTDLKLETKILYVGKKSTSGFSNRILQHLGYSNSLKIYALHLAHWVGDIDIDVTLNFVVPDMKGKEILEEVESILHFGLKPLMGRSGH